MSVRYSLLADDVPPETEFLQRGPQIELLSKSEYSFPDLAGNFAPPPTQAPPTVSPDDSLGNLIYAVRADVQALLETQDHVSAMLTTAVANISDTSGILKQAQADVGQLFDEASKFAVNIWELDTRVGAAEASITTETSLRASADEALAAQITDLNASLGTTNANLLTEEGVRATADTALAASITSLSATVTSDVSTLTANLTSESLTRASQDSALAASISSLSATVTSDVGTLSASITTESITRAGADSTISANLSALSTTVAGNSANITTLTTSVNGLSVQWAVQANLNGTTGHLEFTGLQKADGTGALYVFDILADVNIHGTLILNGTVVNDKLAGETATAIRAIQIASGSFTATYDPLHGVYVDTVDTVINYTFSVAIAGPTTIRTTGSISSNDGCRYALYIDGATLTSDSNNVGFGTAIVIDQQDTVTLAAGSHTLRLDIGYNGGSYGVTYWSKISSLVFMGSK